LRFLWESVQISFCHKCFVDNINRKHVLTDKYPRKLFTAFIVFRLLFEKKQQKKTHTTRNPKTLKNEIVATKCFTCKGLFFNRL